MNSKSGIMSPKDFKEKMLIISQSDDTKENKHIKMDSLMGGLLISFGYKDGIEVFDNTEKYYV